jgi:hypothetical protein
MLAGATTPWGDPPALPGRQQKFDISGSVLHHFCDCDATSRPMFHEVLAFASGRLRSGPFEGPATVKLPALPGDIYVCRACLTAWGWKSPSQPDGGEVIAKRNGIVVRRGRKEAWSKRASR